ncbi:MAG: hypothetical protein ACE5DI_04000 [Candidatus Micrarchaeia archaeon]
MVSELHIGDRFRVDLYLPKHNLAIEVQSLHHGKTRRMLNDLIKKNKLEEQGVPLVCWWPRYRVARDAACINRIIRYVQEEEYLPFKVFWS